MKFDQATTNQVTTSVFFAIGLAIWFGIPRFTEHNEAWDSIWYLVMIPAGFLAGVSNPRRPSYPVLALIMAQFAAFLVQFVMGPSGPLAILAPIAFAAIYGIVLFMAWVGAWVRPKIRWRRRLALVFVPLVVFVVMPGDAEAHTYYYDYGFTVGYPTHYSEYGEIWQITVLYDYNWQQIGSAQMWHYPPATDGWLLHWSNYTPQAISEVAPV
jgi:hypothetical protein